MGAMGVAARSAITIMGRSANELLSFIVFSVIDVLDVLLCVVYKTIDFFIEAEWKPCYCSSAKEAITSTGKILVSERGGESKVLRVSSSKLQLEDISDTLYTRSSFVSDVSKSTVKELTRLKVERRMISSKRSSSDHQKNVVKNNGANNTIKSMFTINSTIVEMLEGKIEQKSPHPISPRWSDCDCKVCNHWSSSCRDTLYLHVEGPPKDKVEEDVLFIHGFISSSTFWTETIFPKFSAATKSRFRLIAVDILGFGRSPKPSDSLYTLREHVEMIEKSVMEPYKVKQFHIVAHSLGCILALAIAVKYPKAIKSLTLIAPPYFPVPKGEQPTQYVMRRVAPRRVWPLIAFGSSLACWYEHVSRTICLVICKHHRLWDFIIRFVTRNRIKTFLVDGFMCHTHNAAWHTLHNIICGTARKMDGYMDYVRDQLKCDVTIYHGRDDELLPVECSYNVKEKIPRAHVKVIEKKDHVTIVVGRQKAFARELEEIWKRSSMRTHMDGLLQRDEELNHESGL